MSPITPRSARGRYERASASVAAMTQIYRCFWQE
nr:MAG TPA: hypothetical protein [Caudoviricetes sp.]